MRLLPVQRRERKSVRRTPARGDPGRVIRKFFRLLEKMQREGRAGVIAPPASQEIHT